MLRINVSAINHNFFSVSKRESKSGSGGEY